MDKLLACATAFHNLLDVEYRIVLGRKNQLTELHIRFEAVHFHHLMGLGKLKDLQVATRNRSQIFGEILSGSFSYRDIAISDFVGQIENRFSPLSQIETVFDNNNLVFRYNERLHSFSMIQADFLLSTPIDGNDIYVFLVKNDNDENYFCRSFFPKETTDYTVGQTKYALLYKEKIKLSTGEKEIQYDRLNKDK
ncbi:PBECR4 domain-containing protein [Bengtsoniella intestinalis]|uniref:PBECR4 domain-containing protein n=1 Tax=Bengtsoniella intestinalis TaxID=3073143 RepID=UPI00391F3953